jgi:hypothetical protein
MGGACLLLLAHPPRASAHLLDAYLQAAQISIDPQQVMLDMYLTPGVQIAPGVIATVDTNHDGVISATECQAYAEAVLPRLRLSADGKPLRLQLTASDSASTEELREGTGSLHFKAIAQLPPLRSGMHNVRFENTFRPAGSLYLANAMLPRDPRVTIGEQNRDALQTSEDITYELRATKAEIALRVLAGFVIAAAAGGGLWWFKRLRRRDSKTISA